MRSVAFFLVLFIFHGIAGEMENHTVLEINVQYVVERANLDMSQFRQDVPGELPPVRQTLSGETIFWKITACMLFLSFLMKVFK